ncbi:MAG: tryptophan synthase subunit alpha [Eubacteriales bacterium]|nr:tryptophan synthase subunit alpha [Eubacteriales bacterium]
MSDLPIKVPGTSPVTPDTPATTATPTNRLEKKLAELATQGRKALIPFIVAGDPDLRTSQAIARTILHSGADILEIGVPFSDPSADGPTIMAADARALAHGTSIVDAFHLVRELRAETQKPILFLLYYNTVVQMGLDLFFATCRDVGVDGIIVPDLPLEEQDEVGPIADSHDVIITRMVSPLSGPRLSELTVNGRGFVYCVAALGVTGERSELSADLSTFEMAVRAVSPIPRALGFGISTPDQVRELAAGWDGIIVGSAIVRRIGEGHAAGLNAQQLADQLGIYVSSLREALDEGTLAALQGG